MKDNFDKTAFIEKLVSGDENALKQLYVNNFAPVQKYVLQNNGTMEQAKDVYQDAFLATWNHLKTNGFSESSPGSVNGFLVRIAKNKWLDYLRSSTYKKTTFLTENIMDNTENVVLNSAEGQEEDDARLKKIRDAFRTMGDECRAMLIKFYFQKKSMKEIAMLINIDEASARNKKYRCMQKLRELALGD